MSDDLVDDLLGGEDEEELGNEDESVLQDIFGPNSGNLKTNKESTLDIENEIAINRGIINNNLVFFYLQFKIFLSHLIVLL